MSLVFVDLILGVGGIPVNELNQMELEFLKLCDFSLLITPEELVECGDSLLNFSMNYRAGQAFILPPLLNNPHLEFRDDIKSKDLTSESPHEPPPTIMGRENILTHSSSSNFYQLDDIYSASFQMPIFQESTTISILPEPTLLTSTLAGAVARRIVRLQNVNNFKQSLIKHPNARIQRKSRKNNYGWKWKTICDGTRQFCIKCKKLSCRCKR
jgi:Cyclin